MDDEARERRVAPQAVPAGLAPHVADRTWFRDAVGESGCAVFRLAREGDDDRYLKVGRGSQLGDLVDEMTRLRWLESYLPVPTLMGFAIEEGAGWMVTSRMAGRTAYQILEAAPEQAPALAGALGLFLRRLHGIPVERCPFNADHRLRLAAAKDRLDAGLVAEDEFDEARQGMSARAVWEEMLAALPPGFDHVVTHGDFSLDNLFVVDGAVTGCIDLGRVGIADPWQDLAILWHSLAEFGAEAPRRMLAAYGIALDPAKLDFHLRLDEFF
ncbi:APH(3') family aminoglycoside O-phosphotransferase [Sphingomonas sp. R1]|uniref:APH(3') family aminoglycoside O-phosphotransferase n=1 Tax=Sphingomonas sp. R1 TaxID=399176 RepID=UPI002224FC57|nr:APH(3') family aminoglycoside O-phosphotransferase [Sphingomonas sp. R1]UYY77251.1 aminoglycoside 3'-phosphotransferase [Sphingomonas sp. R1]